MTGATNADTARRRRPIGRLAVRLTVAIAACAAACAAVVTALFLDSLRRYGLFERREQPFAHGGGSGSP